MSKTYAQLKAEHDREKERLIRQEINDPNTDMSRRIYLANLETHRRQSHENYEQNKDRYKQSARKYRQEHAEEIRRKNHEYYLENRELRLAYGREQRMKAKEERNERVDKDNSV